MMSKFQLKVMVHEFKVRYNMQHHYKDLTLVIFSVKLTKKSVQFYLHFNKTHARYDQVIGLEIILGIYQIYEELLVFVSNF